MDDLYRENILEHYKQPRNFGELPDPDLEFEDNNPLCGDELKVQLKVGEDNRIADVHPHDLATILDQAGVCVRAGHHCAQPLMRRLGVAATARASFWVYSDPSDVDALVRGLDDARALFGV